MAKFELYHGDCVEILPRLAKGIDAVVTDPPYGIDWNCDYSSWIKPSSKMQGGNNRRSYPKLENDKDQIDPTFLLSFPVVVLWGATYFFDYLGNGSLLVWHKRSSGFLADAEVAWMNRGGGVYVYRFPVEKMQKDRVHPTQKPVEVMKWCIEKATKPGDMILDPYMGSGSTGVAAMQTGRDFTGIEITKSYFDIAKSRIEEAARQPSLLEVGGITTNAVDLAPQVGKQAEMQLFNLVGDGSEQEPQGN